MDRASINDVELAFEVTGEGEPILLIHGSFIADAMLPLAERLEGYTLIRYHRRGYGESAGDPVLDVTTHAGDARALLEHLDAAPAHLIGHSYGGTTALQLATIWPDLVRTLVLLEPALMHIPSAATVQQGIAAVTAPLEGGDVESAINNFLRTLLGPDWQRMVADCLAPRAISQIMSDGDDAFAGDLTSLGVWTFGEDEAARITCPTLLVLGGASDETVRQGFAEFGVEAAGVEVFAEMIEVINSEIPQSVLVMLPGLNHALQMQDPIAVARALVPFLAQHHAPLLA
jgi:pimeloyl-ACP methyl ester carboxylesterase